VSAADRRAQRRARTQRPVLWAGSSPGGDYTGKLLDAIRRGDIPLVAGTVQHIRVSHDNDCPTLRSTPGLCRCDADFRLISEAEAIDLAVRKAKVAS
jgi:hypothetical protein